MFSIPRNFTAAAAVAALLVSGVAAAAPASVTTELNMRSGPGTGYSVVQVLRAGSQVEADCSTGASWCAVSYYGMDGWVSSRYLTSYVAPQTAYNPPVYSPPAYRPPVYAAPAYTPPAAAPPATGLAGALGGIDPAIIGLGAALLGGVLGNAFGDDDDADADNNNGDRERDRTRNGACFFEDGNFGGGQFCLSEGDGERRLGDGWNDNISSARLARGVEVQLCADENFDGRCVTIDGDTARFNSMNNEVSSLRVR